MHIAVESPIEETPRVLQVRGIFDLTPSATSSMSWEVELPLTERPWNIGLLVGPSGCGKSTIARRLWPDALALQPTWPATRSVLDGFPADLPIKELIELLSSVGFSSPPAWLRPFHVLSTGQQFRVTLAWLLAATPERLVVCDEYTSVVDRTVAQIGSAAVAKTVRRRGQRFVAITCHEDVEEWLQPDWVYRPAEQRFTWRSLQRRPPIELSIVRCRRQAWPAFAHHHYLSHRIATAAVCFLATWQGRPVAFSAWLPFVGVGRPGKREHRTVTLPDYQGVGAGNAVSATIASMWKALGFRATSTTTHPAMIAARNRSPLWLMHRRPSLSQSVEKKYRGLRHATTRLTAGFTYCGPAMPFDEAKALYG
ncbi:MAG TPA: ABC transporter ATP-binding protein [Gemmataceae bacterium]|nr:ABC transporter ATP-binding protein [Gemmataceae bacterium]